MSFNEAVGGALALLGALAIVYLAVTNGSQESVGALVALVAAASGYFLRAKVQPPSGPGGPAA